MFDKIFSKKNEDVPSFEETNNPNKIDLPSTPKPASKTDIVYQVGYTEDNRVSLTIGNGLYSSSLLMNDDGVRRLIKMLEVAISPDEEDVEDCDDQH